MAGLGRGTRRQRGPEPDVSGGTLPKQAEPAPKVPKNIADRPLQIPGHGLPMVRVQEP